MSTSKEKLNNDFICAQEFKSVLSLEKDGKLKEAIHSKENRSIKDDVEFILDKLLDEAAENALNTNEPEKYDSKMWQQSLDGSKSSFNVTGHTQEKVVRPKRTPSRYHDCLLDDSPIIDQNFLLHQSVLGKVNKSKDVCNSKIRTKKVKFSGYSDEASSSENITSSEKLSCTKPPSYSIDYHGSTFDSDGNFRFKLNKEHTIRSRTGGLTSYRCDICEMIFPRSFSLRRHYERIHINPRYVRNKGKKDQEMVRKLLDNDRKKNLLKTNKALQAEENSNATEETESKLHSSPDDKESEDTSFFVYACKLCSRFQLFFKTKHLLRKHFQSRHLSISRKKVEPYKCESCERSYTTRHELQRHKRTHSGERPYSCRYCAKRFPTSTNARRHERTHTGDRPHICKVCSKRFLQKTDMLKHLRTVHRMKVTRTKEEQLLAKEAASGRTKTAVEESSNQFEENIDFAAYLKLDQFEKGSLMGGSVTETSIFGMDGKQASHHSSENILDKNSFETETTYKCPECFKSFGSRVNMRRHYRLKHERNQVSALPVSMVVKKFQFHDSDKRDWNEESNKVVKEISNPSPATSPSFELPSISSSKQSKTNKASVKNLPHSSVNATISHLFTPDKKYTGPHQSENFLSGFKPKKGSKLGKILERLSIKREKENLSLPTQINSQSKKENLITSDTLLQSMQPVRKKIHHARSDTSPFSSKRSFSNQQANSKSPKNFSEKNQSGSYFVDAHSGDKKIKPKEMSSGEGDKLKNKIFMEKTQPTFHPYPSKFHYLKERVSKKHQFSKDEGINHLTRKVFKNRNLSWNTAPCISIANKKVWRDSKREALPSFTANFEKKISFLDNCWRNKMNDLPNQKPSVYPWNQSVWDNINTAKTAYFADQNIGSSPFNVDAPMDLKYSPNIRADIQNEERSSSIPLDLSQPKKDKGSPFTDDGVLDLSYKLPSKGCDVEVKNQVVRSSHLFPHPFPLVATTFAEANLQNYQPNKIWPPLQDASTVFDPRGIKLASNHIPLKFHSVKFDKDKQVHGSGSAGRPSKTFAKHNTYPWFPHQDINSKYIENPSFSRQYRRSNPHLQQKRSDAIFHFKKKESLQHPFSSRRGYQDYKQRHQASNFSFNSSKQLQNFMFGRARPLTKTTSLFTSRTAFNHGILNNNIGHAHKKNPISLSHVQPFAAETRRIFDKELTSDNCSRASNNSISRPCLDNVEKDMMRRCIQKAQHALQKNASSSEENNIRDQQRPPPESTSDSVFFQIKLADIPKLDINKDYKKRSQNKTEENYLKRDCSPIKASSLYHDGMSGSGKEVDQKLHTCSDSNKYPENEMDVVPDNRVISDIGLRINENSNTSINTSKLEITNNEPADDEPSKANKQVDCESSSSLPEMYSSISFKYHNLDAEEIIEEPKIQKIKLRAIKPMNKHGTKKWTLVGCENQTKLDETICKRRQTELIQTNKTRSLDDDTNNIVQAQVSKQADQTEQTMTLQLSETNQNDFCKNSTTTSIEQPQTSSSTQVPHASKFPVTQSNNSFKILDRNDAYLKNVISTCSSKSEINLLSVRSVSASTKNMLNQVDFSRHACSLEINSDESINVELNNTNIDCLNAECSYNNKPIEPLSYKSMNPDICESINLIEQPISLCCTNNQQSAGKDRVFFARTKETTTYCKFIKPPSTEINKSESTHSVLHDTTPFTGTCENIPMPKAMITNNEAPCSDDASIEVGYDMQTNSSNTPLAATRMKNLETKQLTLTSEQYNIRPIEDVVHQKMFSVVLNSSGKSLNEATDLMESNNNIKIEMENSLFPNQLDECVLQQSYTKEEKDVLDIKSQAGAAQNFDDTIGTPIALSENDSQYIEQDAVSSNISSLVNLNTSQKNLCIISGEKIENHCIGDPNLLSLTSRDIAEVKLTIDSGLSNNSYNSNSSDKNQSEVCLSKPDIEFDKDRINRTGPSSVENVFNYTNSNARKNIIAAQLVDRSVMNDNCKNFSTKSDPFLGSTSKNDGNKIGLNFSHDLQNIKKNAPKPTVDSTEKDFVENMKHNNYVKSVSVVHSAPTMIWESAASGISATSTVTRTETTSIISSGESDFETNQKQVDDNINENEYDETLTTNSILTTASTSASETVFIESSFSESKNNSIISKINVADKQYSSKKKQTDHDQFKLRQSDKNLAVSSDISQVTAHNSLKVSPSHFNFSIKKFKSKRNSKNRKNNLLFLKNTNEKFPKSKESRSIKKISFKSNMASRNIMERNRKRNKQSLENLTINRKSRSKSRASVKSDVIDGNNSTDQLPCISVKTFNVQVGNVSCEQNCEDSVISSKPVSLQSSSRGRKRKKDPKISLNQSKDSDVMLHQGRMKTRSFEEATLTPTTVKKKQEQTRQKLKIRQIGKCSNSGSTRSNKNNQICDNNDASNSFSKMTSNTDFGNSRNKNYDFSSKKKCSPRMSAGKNRGSKNLKPREGLRRSVRKSKIEATKK